jgi:hypothetical protein
MMKTITAWFRKLKQHWRRRKHGVIGETIQ